MSEDNFTNEKIIFSSEKQKELYDIISDAFSEELKKSNCIILPMVGQRVGAAMREKGFEKANRATFLAAPEYFNLGYNEKNADAISLVGYPEDPNFSTTPNADYVSIPKRNSIQLTSEQQKQLAEIFVQKFRTHNNGGKVFLSMIGLKAGKTISEAGLGRVSIELFKRASDYFDYTQDSNGAYIVYLKDDCGIVMPSKETKPKINKNLQIKEKKSFEDILFAKLKKTYKTNDVSVRNIFMFLRNNKIVLPEYISSFEELTELLIKKFGGVIRDNGEGTSQEQYIILRKTLPVPENICKRVELIVAQFFLDRDLIPNADIGQVLKSNGINFADYNFADLTAFLRSFTNIFTIVAQPAANNKFHIFVRIIPSFRERYADVKINHENQEQILQLQFEKVICEMFAQGKYEAIINQSMLKEAIKHVSGDMWECIIKSYLILNGSAPEDTPNLTNWEKEVFDFDHLSANVSDDFLSSFSFSKEEVARIKQYVLDYTHKTVNYSILAQRIQTLCDKDSYIVGVILNIGLIARVQSDKVFCFRLLMLYYSRNDEKKMRELWDEYAESYINPSSIIMILETLFVEGKLDFVLELADRYYAINDSIEAVQLYRKYANILRGELYDNMPRLDILKSRRAIELVAAFLEYAKTQKSTDLYIEMVYNCIRAQNEFVPISAVSDILKEHSEFLNEQYHTLIQKAENGDRESLIVLRQLIYVGAIMPDDTWKNINNSILEDYKIKIKECPPESKESILYEAIELFPTENLFVDELVSIIKSTGSSDGENLEGFIDNLIDCGNYEQVIMLYEHDSTLEIRDKAWFLRKLSYCYQKNQEPQKSLYVEMAIISSMLNDGEKINDCLTHLISMLYDSFVSCSLIFLDEETATRLLELFTNYQCESINAHKYWIAMMGLALCTKNIPLLSLLYCLSDGSSDETAFLEICENEIQESTLGYAYRVGDIQKTFEYVLTQEKPEVFLTILGRAANVIRADRDEKIYFKIRESGIEKIEPEKIITLIISEYNKERAWKLLSEYAYKSKKVTLNFVANSVWFFRFKDTSYALSNCTNALERYVDNSLPRNILWCCLCIWNTNIGRPVEGYKSAFIEHIRKCKTFQNASPDIVAQWYDMLCNKRKSDQNDFITAIEIAKQSSSFGTFYTMFFKDDSAYKTLISRDVASFILFSSAFVYCADDESFHEVLDEIRELRNQIGSFSISKNDRSALMWIDNLMANRTAYTSDDYFLEASMAVLSSYPAAPSNDIVSKWITPDSSHRLPNYDLLRNWINTFGNMRIVNSADYAIRNYISKNYLSDDIEERENFFKIRFFLAEKYIVFFNRLHPNTNDDFLRRCEAYYGLRKLAKVVTPIPADFKDKMHKDLEYFNKLEAYLNYEAGVDAFASAVNDDYIRERFIYCGITNYWDRVLESCLNICEDILPYVDAIEDYFKVIDYRPVRRRLLQMYVFSSAGQIMFEEDGDNDNIESISNLKDVRYYYNRISNGDIVISDYLSSVSKLSEILQPSLLDVIKLLEDTHSNCDRVKVIQSIIFALSNKDLNQFRAKIESVDEDALNNIVLPTVIAIQHGNDISKMMLQMSLNNEKYADVLLNNESLSSVIGKYETNLFKSILCINCDDYDGAAKYLSLAGSRGDTYGLLYDRLHEAVVSKSKLDIEEDFGVSIHYEDALPKFSFMKTSDPSGMGLQQLVSDFYSENLYDAKGKCLVASKILSLIEDGAHYNDTINLLFDWGFVEIEATFDIEKKANILFEMLDNIDKLKDVKVFKERFVRNFLYVLQEFDFTILVKNFKRIFNCHMILYSRFSPYDNCDCYAQAIIMLRDLYKLGKENIDPNAAMNEVNAIKSRILALHIRYPQNRFATKCIDYVERFVQQIFERGVFEVSILNVDHNFDGVVYYQVRNKGYELISNITLTFLIEGISNTIEQVRIGSIIPEGLRPNQVYAGEYSPSVNVKEGTVIGCSITVEYSITDEEGQEVYKNYVAVDPNTDGRLTVTQNNSDVYQKDGSAGYSEEPIKQKSDFIGRKNELNRIMGKILKGQNVLLFGTNGTGKSSILYNIRKVCLYEAYSDESMNLGKHYATELKFDIDCTERNVLESIVNAVSGATLFKVFVKRNGNEETQDILALAAEEWTANVEKIFDKSGVCTNTDAVRQYFVTLDEALSLSNLDLYILLDQFERVISSKNIDSKHMLFLRDMSCQKIRFIMAGSNYLLEEVSVDKINNQQENSWSDIFSRGFEKVKIGNMDQEDFELLITQKNALNNGAMRYTAEALDYLWQFTKGHAFYSCLLGNRTLDIMSSRKVKRNVIYPSDIFIAIYQSGKYLPNEKSNKEKETAIKDQIFQDIIDNTPIKLVGKTLAKMQSSGERKVSYQKLRDYIEEHRPDILEDFADALSVLVARDFITYDEIDIQRQSDRSENEDVRTAREYFFTSDLYLEHFATVYVPELSTKEREAIESKNQSIDELVTDLRTRKFSAEDIGKVREALKEFVSNGPTTVIHTDTLVGTNTGTFNSQKIGTQNVVTINAQTINTAFTTLLTPGITAEAMLEAFSSLPRMTAYLLDDQVARVKQLSSDLADADDIKKETIIEKIEEITIPAEQRMLGDTLCAALDSDDLVGVDENQWRNLLGMGTDIEGLRNLPTEYLDLLKFALMIHGVFEKIRNAMPKEKQSELDYCPVAIMYCKLVENMLKHRHTPMYIDCLGEKTMKPGGDTFSSLGTPEKFNYRHKHLAIGSFSYHLVNAYINVYSPFKSTFSFDKKNDNDYEKNIDELSAGNEDRKEMWMEHAQSLAYIHQIRNKSAHEALPISKKVFDLLIRELFHNGELLRIFELSK